VIINPRSDTPTSILIAMKQLVLACKNISEEIDSHESRMPHFDQSQVAGLKVELSTGLTNLMHAARGFATQFGKVDEKVIEDPVEVLSIVVYKLVNLVPVEYDHGYAVDVNLTIF